jgi:hypothetical protein
MPSQLDVVEADDRHVARDTDAAFAQSLEGPQGRLVVGAHESIDRWWSETTFVEETANGRHAGVADEVPRHHETSLDTQTVVDQRALVGLTANDGVLAALRAPSEGDAPAAVRLDQMGDSLVHPALVVDHDRRDSRDLHAQGDARPWAEALDELTHLVGVSPKANEGRRDQQRVDPRVPHNLEGLVSRIGLVKSQSPSRHRQEVETVLAGLPFGDSQKPSLELVLERVGEKDQSRPAGLPTLWVRSHGRTS